MSENLKHLIGNLDKMGIQPFIGYGNPDADILIVGKECAFKEGSDDWKKFYEPNFRQWKESYEGHGFGYRHGEQPYTFEHGNFHPIYPFFKQYNKIHRGVENDGRTTATYFYYQRLIDKIRKGNAYEYTRSDYIDFFNDCFITELNNKCRPNNNNLKVLQHKETEKNIRERFDWMRKTNFFNQFKVVIFACGPYARKITPVLEKELFGEAFVIRCHQLSFWDKSLDDKILEIHNLLK